MLFLIVLMLVCDLCQADYPCLCCYGIEKPVLDEPKPSSPRIGYMHEFDCKPLLKLANIDAARWSAVGYNNQQGFVEMDSQLEHQTCPGEPSASDLVTTAIPENSTASSITKSLLQTVISSTTEMTSAPNVSAKLTTLPLTVSTQLTTQSGQKTGSQITSAQQPITDATSTPTTPTQHHTSNASTSTMAPQSFTHSSTPTSSPATKGSHTIRPTTVHSTTISQNYTDGTTSTVPSGNTSLCPALIVQYAAQDNEILAQMGDSCYTLVPHKVSWTHAEAVCSHRGGHLFHIIDKSENLFFDHWLGTHFNHSVWMGLHDTVREEHFQWTSGDPVVYTNWIPGRKSNFFSHDKEDCAVFVPYLNNGQWDDIPCGVTSPTPLESLQETHYFICQFPLKQAATAVNQVQSGNLNLCPSQVRYYASLDGSDLTQYDKKCYERVDDRKSWNNAEQDCRRLGGHLLQISSLQEQAFIQSFLTRVDSQHAIWIGLHDQGHEESFTWTSGANLTYSNWIPGRKSNFYSHNVEDCVVMIPYKQGKWDDVPCGGLLAPPDLGSLQQNFETHPYICEFNTVVSGSSAIIGK